MKSIKNVLKELKVLEWSCSGLIKNILTLKAHRKKLKTRSLNNY